MGRTRFAGTVGDIPSIASRLHASFDIPRPLCGGFRRFPGIPFLDIELAFPHRRIEILTAACREQ